MQDRQAKIVVNREPGEGSVRFSFGIRWTREDGTYDVARSVIMENVPKEGFIRPFLSLTDKETQTLMDELWRAGFRPREGPREGTGSAGLLAATEKHLQDMRKLVFHIYEIEEG